MAGPGSQAKDRQANATRNSRTGQPGNANRDGASGANASGMSASAADHLIALGKIKAKSIPATGVAQGNFPTQDDAYDAFSKAVGDWGTRNFGNKAADFLLGGLYDENEPMAGNPRSFAGGRFHSSTNPAGVVAGIAAPFGSGFIAGPVASKAWNAAGAPNVWHGGMDQPDVRTGPFGNAPAGTDLGGSFSDIGGVNGTPGGSSGTPNPGGASSTGNSPGMAAFQSPIATTPGGAPFGAQPAQPAADPMGAFFRPGLPNHSLPQGFNSAFPNSLNEQDKALLYARALGGAA